MSEPKDTGEKPSAPVGAGQPTAAALDAVAKLTETKHDDPAGDVPNVEAPSIVASAGEPSESEIRKPERITAEDLKAAHADLPPSGKSAAAAMVVAAIGNNAPKRSGRFALLAGVVALAAAIGALAGGFAAAGLAQSAQAPAEAAAPTAATADVAALQDTLAQLRGEVAALKASVDTAARNTSTQFSRIGERFDRLERRADVAPAKETTGSIAAVAAPAAPAAAAQPPVVEGWVLRDVIRGVAILQSRRMGIVEAEAGDVLPGVGRVEAIRRQEGKWVVVTSKGLITAMR